MFLTLHRRLLAGTAVCALLLFLHAAVPEPDDRLMIDPVSASAASPYLPHGFEADVAATPAGGSSVFVVPYAAPVRYVDDEPQFPLRQLHRTPAAALDGASNNDAAWMTSAAGRGRPPDG